MNREIKNICAVAACRNEKAAIRAVQTETAAELVALLPAILDRVFKGEL